ncbi:cystathionine gamma-synthase/O-succinylhomoserine sulfhydrylase [Altererythrobacter atlanticus]|uniref:O-succinylhomoserine sulfhydrylase n=1 Tax=Croceibacterium atlanticum TaxID=1267766 RepID=A0A0F7KNY1_9SPHN|nr:aminotransferase class I/II-fold pyridoxal phosphate-dependent enzyme [Croceibacterium atlanticum]AKH42208.1 O-succinylhomoserine sulfhydrylase [Croceibacterium atlanticum]MBB5733980.1 cystathionine gamma-synthase/O-succinylhomoserine sulfhydrylase [Croceibacterium atlanticum]
MKRTTGTDRSITSKWRPQTRAVRGGTWRSEQGETSEALFLNSGYSYDDAQTPADRFAGEAEGMVYSRMQNPTTQMLEERIALMEGAEACRVQATGMAAMTCALLCQLSAGDHIVAGRAAFGSCRWIVDNLLPRFGIEKTVIDARDNAAWEAAIRPNTKVFFFETPANPTMDVVDLAFVCGLARSHGITSVVDNAFATAVLQRPLEFGADVVAYSATKLMDGQGRVLAGALCSSEEWIQEKLMPFQRNTGPILAPFNAWVVLKALETLELRANKQSENAMEVAKFLEGRVPQVLYPGLPSHPQHELCMKQMSHAGAIFSFVMDGREQAMGLLDALELIDISNNIGDSRSLMTHPATTTHHNMGPEGREEAGVAEGMLRLNVGLEDPQDLIEDLDRALGRIGL